MAGASRPRAPVKGVLRSFSACMKTCELEGARANYRGLFAVPVMILRQRFMGCRSGVPPSGASGIALERVDAVPGKTHVTRKRQRGRTVRRGACPAERSSFAAVVARQRGRRLFSDEREGRALAHALQRHEVIRFG